MKKNLLKSLLAIIVLLSSTNALAYDFEVGGIYYNILASNTCQVTYNGSKQYSGSIVIPETVNHSGKTLTVTSIGNRAFEDCIGLTSVTIPSTIIEMGEYAFKDSGLKKVIVKDIAAWCGIFFDNYSNPLLDAGHLYSDEDTEIKELVIPNSVTSIGSSAFRGCSGLESVTIGNSVTEIGDYAFEDCSGLTSVMIGNSVKKIGDMAFYWCPSLTSIEIPNSVTEIGFYAFGNCSSLINVTIPNSVTNIGYSMFEGCSSLESVTIGNSVTEIGSGAFYGCDALTTIYSLNTTPPNLEYYTFMDDHYNTVNVFVPQEALNAYQNAYGWWDFKNLKAFDPTGIESVKGNAINGNNVYYDLNGNRLDAPKKGLNIINGKKVMVK